jgi:acetyltransferase-like isoleucine patch superfamily enzyme
MSEPTSLGDDWFPRPLPANVVLGERTWLYSAFAFVHYRSDRPCGLRVGHDTGIYTETFFDLGPHGEVEIGNYCTIAGPILSINGRARIGDYVLISREVVLADSFAAAPPGGWPGPGSTGEIVVGDRAWIGSRAVLLGGARLGEGVIVGASAVVNFEVPAFAIVAGNPAHIVGWARPREG